MNDHPLVEIRRAVLELHEDGESVEIRRPEEEVQILETRITTGDREAVEVEADDPVEVAPVRLSSSVEEATVEIDRDGRHELLRLPDLVEVTEGVGDHIEPQDDVWSLESASIEVHEEPSPDGALPL